MRFACSVIVPALAIACATPRVANEQFALTGVPIPHEPVQIRVSAEVLGPVPDLLFGQMLERTRFHSGEMGAEAAWDAERGDWRPEFIEAADAHAPTIIRFPGGGEADRSDWRWGIDRVPGREPGRHEQAEEGGASTTHSVGTHEFVDLCRRVGAEPTICVNVAGFRDDPEAGASLAADWVEYCNSPDDGSNPRGGVDWAAVRAANGAQEPFGIHLWELGNEVWIPPNDMEPPRYREVIRPYVEAMRDADPSIRFIAMGQDGRWARASVDACGEALRYVSHHAYSIFEIGQEGLTLEETWRAAVSGPPDHFLEQVPEVWEALVGAGVEDRVGIAVNEWNCNMWFRSRPAPHLTPDFRMVGAAAMLHELMRRGDEIEMACMSMLVGTLWSNTAIRIDPEDPERSGPWPFHALMTLYRAQHGGERLGVEMLGCPTYDSDQSVGNTGPRRAVPLLDVVATRSEESVFVHLISRAMEGRFPVEIAVPDAPSDGVGQRFEIYQRGALIEDRALGAPQILETGLRIHGGTVALEIPPHSVTVLVWPLR